MKRSKPMRRTRLKARSRLMESKMAVYRALRERFLKEKPYCEACAMLFMVAPEIFPPLAGLCVADRSIDVHHAAGRGKHLLDVSTWKAVDRRCHDYIETHKRWARSVGLITYQ